MSTASLECFRGLEPNVPYLVRGDPELNSWGHQLILAKTEILGGLMPSLGQPELEVPT